jgi:hypothetical protein
MLKRYILLSVLFSLLFSFESKGQCVEADAYIPPCIVVGDPVTFLNTSIDNTVPSSICDSLQTTEYEWEIEDWNGNYSWDTITVGTNTNINHPGFPASGWYTLTLDPDVPGPNNNCCINTTNGTPDIEIDFYVTNNSVSIQTIDTITICGGNPIDTSNINLTIFNSSNNVSFSWVTIPNGSPVGGTSSGNISSTETAIVLTVTDDATQCSDSDTITLSFLPTSITTPTVIIDPDSAVCAGNTINFYVDSPDTTLFSYEWDIQGQTYNGDSINTSLFPTIPNVNENISVDLIITEDSSGCSEIFSYNISISGTPFIDLDISNNNGSLTGWDSTLQVFLVCDISNALVNLTFGNSTLTSNQNYDSIIFYWPDTIEIIDSNHILYPFNSGQNISHLFYENWPDNSFSITAFNNGCSFTTNYDVVIGSNLNTPALEMGFLSGTNCTNNNTIFYESLLENIGLNDSLIWRVFCGTDTIYTEIWGFTEFDSAYSINPIPGQNDSVHIFEFDFPESSCDCDLPPATQDEYLVEMTVIEACTNPAGQVIRGIIPVKIFIGVDTGHVGTR